MGADAPIFMYFNRSNQFYNNSVAQSGTSSNKTIVRLFITIINLKKKIDTIYFIRHSLKITCMTPPPLLFSVNARKSPGSPIIWPNNHQIWQSNQPLNYMITSQINWITKPIQDDRFQFGARRAGSLKMYQIKPHWVQHYNIMVNYGQI